MTEILLLSLDLDEQVRSECEAWVDRFAEIAAAEPLGVQCEMEWVEGSLREGIEARLEGDLAASTGKIGLFLMDNPRWAPRDDVHSLSLPKIAAFCRNSNTLVTEIQRNAPRALWGVAIDRLCVIYHHEPASIWHEMFHLLGADDCYKIGDRGIDDRSCGNQRCVMQYAPTLEVVGNPPSICRGNVARIREQCGTISHREEGWARSDPPDYRREARPEPVDRGWDGSRPDTPEGR